MSKMTRLDYYAIIILGTMILLFGAMMNMMVIGFNDGRMPVRLNYDMSGDNHFGYSDPSEVVLSQLSDKFIIFNVVFSLGDIIMFISLCIVVFTIIYFKVKNRKKKV